MNTLDAYVAAARQAPAPISGQPLSTSMRLALLLAHQSGGTLSLSGTGVTRPTAQALARRGDAELTYETGRKDRRKVIDGFALTLQGDREIRRFIRKG